ncbi:MAG: hypothetical protein ACTSR3_11730 [Candidatus Helarchaeota archaeon]
MEQKNEENEEDKDFDLKIPPGTPEDIVATAIEKFNLKLIVPPEPEKSPYYMALRGKKHILVQAHDFIRDELEKRVEKFESQAKDKSKLYKEDKK